MRPTLSILTFALLLPALPVAQASIGDCDSKGHIALGIVSIGGAFYIDDRNFVFGNGIWVYEESNGIPWLQRGSGTTWPGDEGEICTDDPDVLPDRLIF